MMERGTVRNMKTFIQKNKFWEINESSWLYYNNLSLYTVTWTSKIIRYLTVRLFNFCCMCEVCAFSKHSPNCMQILKAVCMLFFRNETNLRSICYGQHFRPAVVPLTRMLTLNVNFVVSDQLTPSCVYGPFVLGPPTPIRPCSQMLL